MSLKIILPTLEELRDFYAALDPDEIAATGGSAHSCILANAVTPQNPGTRLAVSVCEPENYDDSPGTIWTDELYQPMEILATLTSELNAMAWDFDHLPGRYRNKTAAECVALIEAHIQKRDASASAPT